jgi:hypothetical protein
MNIWVEGMRMDGKEREEYNEFVSKMKLIQEEYVPSLGLSGFKLIFSKAWDEGHADGYENIEWHFRENCEFVRDILKVIP